MEKYWQDIVLWSQQQLPLYWLLAAVFLSLLLLLIIGIRSGKKIKHIDQEREELALTKASNQQLIENISTENDTLKSQVTENTQRLDQLIAQAAELKSSRDEKSEQLKNNENERFGQREIIENNQRKISNLEAGMREQNAILAAERDKLAAIKTEFERQKGELKTEFKAVSEEIIKERQAMLSKQNSEGVGALLKPLQEQIAGFQQRVNEVHTESIKGNAALKGEIDNVMKMGIKMRDEASNLTTALKGDSQQRGAWGEAQLERTLELSGLIAGDHYQKQSAFTDDQGKRKQTDYIVKLPDDKCIIIDSKVSLIDYERACSAELEHQATAMKLHVNAVRKHMDDLASKDYANLSAIHSPDFVLMFMPVEPAYIEAMKHDTELFAYGYRKNVIMVSHTTLIPILRTVANLWMLERSNKEARQLGNAANDIYNSVATVSERLKSLGATLGTASNHYNQAVTALSGKQGLQGKVRRFTELSNKASKDMPELEHKHHEFETNRLEVEALEAKSEEKN